MLDWWQEKGQCVNFTISAPMNPDFKQVSDPVNNASLKWWAKSSEQTQCSTGLRFVVQLCCKSWLDLMSMQYCWTIHPSIHHLSLLTLYRVAGSWNPPSVIGWRRCTPWTGREFIRGQHYQSKILSDVPHNYNCDHWCQTKPFFKLLLLLISLA